MTTRSKRLFAICAFLMIAMFAATGTGSSTLSLNAATEAATANAPAPWKVSDTPTFTPAPVASPPIW